MTGPSRIALIIPAYDAAETVGEVIRRCGQAAPTSPVIVIDDGSVDNTGEIAGEAGCRVLAHARNQGKGAALKTGFAYAVQEGYAAVITLDADLQHAPESIPVFLNAYASGRHDILIGSRTISPRTMPLHRMVSNSISTWMISRFINQRITDSQSGYRLIACRVLRELHLETDGYELESELLIKAGRHGFRIGVIPVETIYCGSRSHFRGFTDTYQFVKLFLRFRR